MKYGTRSFLAITLLVIAGTFNAAHAQKLFFVAARAQYASPLQEQMKNDYGFGIGGEASAGIGFGGKTFLTGTIGYTVFDAKSKELNNLIYVPMKLGLRRYFLPANLLFVHADAGVGRITDKTNDTKYSRFTADIGAGVKLGPLELGVAYDGFSSIGYTGYSSWLSFKAGWRFGM